MSVLDTTMGVALRGLRAVAGLEVLDRYGQRDRLERLVHGAARHGFGGATTVARTFSRVTSSGSSVRATPVSDRGFFDLTPDDEQQALVDALADLAGGELRPAARLADDTCTTPDELVGHGHAFGIGLLGVPTALGGVIDERSATTTVMAAQTLAQGDPGLAASLLAASSVATALALWGSASQQATYLPSFTGDSPITGAIAIDEPQVAGNPMRPTTTARRDGDELILNGTKANVLHVTTAELFLVSVLLDDAPVLVLVEGGASGLSCVLEPTMGIRAAAAGALSLDDVRVPQTAIVGGDADGDVMSELLARSRVAWAAIAVGAGQAVLDHVSTYVGQRSAFGEPISHRQSVAFMVADIAIELDGLRLVTLRAAALADREQPFAEVAALARQLTATRAMQIGDHGVQLLGGHGFVKDHPVERWYRDLRVAGVIEGALLV